MQELYARILAAFFSGALLSLSGSLIQLTSQNDLAGPSTLGIDALCVLVILLVHSFSIFYPISIPEEMLSFFIIFIVTLVIYLAIKYKNRGSKERQNRYFSQMSYFIFLGLCFNLFIGTIFYFLEFIFTTNSWPFPNQLWFGNFRFILPYSLYLLIAGFTIFYTLSIKIAKQVRIISFSKDFGCSLGINVKNVEMISLLVATIVTAIVTSQFGVFAFTGIIFPHFWRNFDFIKYNSSNEIIWAPILSGILFLFFDLLCYYFPLSGAEIPVGMFSSILGSFTLMILLWKRERKKLKKSLL